MSEWDYIPQTNNKKPQITDNRKIAVFIFLSKDNKMNIVFTEFGRCKKKLQTVNTPEIVVDTVVSICDRQYMY